MFSDVVDNIQNRSKSKTFFRSQSQSEEYSSKAQKKMSPIAFIPFWLRVAQSRAQFVRISKKCVKFAFKPGLHELQMTVERSVTLVSSIVVERRRCSLQVSSVARLQENKET